MIKKYIILLVIFLCAFASGFGQTKIAELTFESAGGYTTSVAEFTDGNEDYFTRTDGTSNIAGTQMVFSNKQGTYFFAVHDTNGDGGPNTLSLNFDNINISGYSNLEIRIHIAEDDDGGNQDWDGNSYMHITGTIDSGTVENLICVEATGGTNTEPKIDITCNGTGNGIAITDTFAQFTQNITGIGSLLDIQIEFNALNDGDEDIAIDNIEIWGISSTPTYSVTYNGNGNTGGSVPVDASVYNSGDTATVLGNTGSLTNTCSTFNGWNTATNGSGASYTAGNTFNITANTTLYAQWISTGNTVTFNSNGGTGTMSPQIDCAPTNLINNTFTNFGFTFNSWNTASDGTGVTYTDGAIYNFSSDITLYAQWDVFVGPCASESFNNSANSSSYNTETWTGDDGIDWTATDSRSDQDLNGNEAIMLRNGSLTNDTSFPNGCGVITFDYARKYSGNSTLQVWVNGTQYGGDIAVSSLTSTTFSTAVNVTGNIDIELLNSGNRTLITNLSWTCFSCSAPSDTATFNAISGCTGIDLSWDIPACSDEVLIVARNGSAVTASPIGDGTAYTDNTIFGSGTALLAGQFDVYEGAGSSAIITGLTNGNTYHFTIFSRVGTTWSSGVTDSVTVTVTANNVALFTTYNSCGDISLNWSLPVCFNDVLIVARANNPVAAGTPSGNGSAYTADANFSGAGSNLLSGKVVYKGTGTSETITSLTNGVTYHFKIFTRVGTTWSSGVTDLATSISSSASGPTTFIPGDLVFVGFDSYVGGANDRFSILNIVDIGPSTEFTIANLVYAWNASAGQSENKWYDCYNDLDYKSEPPYVTIRYNGCADIPKGSIICIGTNSSPAAIISITINGIDASSDFSTVDNPSHANDYIAGNISTSNPDAMWLMQGTFSDVFTEPDGADSDTSPDKYRTFSGTVLGGLQTRANFQPISVSGNNGGYRVSRIHPDIECLYLETGATSASRFYGYHNGITTGSHYDLLTDITDVASNWTLVSASSGQSSDDVYAICNSSYNITGSGNLSGQWIGDLSTDWFDCHNWQNFAVPNRATNVIINSISTNDCDIDFTSTNAVKFNYIADCDNITISDNALIINSDGDLVNVNGNLLIENTGVIDMNGVGTIDGQINLYGNWTNNINNNAFDEGNGTIALVGSIIQNISPTAPLGTEAFYNVILNNNFDTSVSNSLFMNGDLIVNPSFTLTVSDGRYVHVENNLTVDGVFNIENNGSLVQGDDNGVNTGNISMDRSASIDAQDYVYWSSPITGFNVNNVSPSSPTNRIYKWNPTFANTNGSFGNWVSAAGETMQEGIGYIIRVPSGQAPPPSPGDLNFTATFNNGVPHNGLVTPSVSHGGNSGSDDDDWNLLGNPYPSAIDAYTFLSQSPNDVLLDGFVNLWTHGNAPSTATSDPFYYDFGSNYTAADYITYNVLGGSYGPGDILIAAGQSFMVNMLDTAPTSGNIVFNNAMRDKAYDNSLFYRSNGSQKNNFRTIEKHRFWIDLVSDNQPTNRILIGYSQDATQERDRMFDAISDNQNFYSLIENEKFIIQGRALPFNDSDVVPLGFKSVSQGSYHIAIAVVDGLFESNNQTIYLKDNVLNFIHDLTVSPYSFSSDIGTFNDRFELVFRNYLLSVDDNIVLSNDITIIELNNNDIKFSLGNSSNTIQEIEIFDALGRTLYRLEGGSHSEVYNLSNLSQSTYFARITLSNGQVITKKAIKSK